MANKIQLKRGTSAPGTILDVGEPGYDSQHKILYVGNGVGQAATSFNPNSLTGASVSGNKLTFTKENSGNVVVTLPVDSAISSTSTNPVQNKVVQSAISTAIANAAEVSVGSSSPSGQQLVWFDNSGSDTKIKVRANSSSNFEEVAGLSGVYVDSGTMPAGYNVQIDPTGEPVDDFFAPAGYGLGNEKVKELTSADDINNIRENGWYAWTNSVPQNAPINRSIMRVWGGVWSGTGNFYCVQELYTGNQNYGNVIMRRTRTSTWGEWEFENPPMIQGVEYRTTERWNGKAVYTRLGSYTFTEAFGNTSTVSNKAISFGSISATRILSAEIFLTEATDRDYVIPITAGNGALVSVNAVLHNGTVVLISNKYAISAGGVMYCTLRYTKD